MSSSTAPVADASLVKAATFTLNLAQAAGTYSFATASGNVDVLGIEFYNDVAASGLVSVVAQTDDTTATALLASVLLAALTGGKPLSSAILAPFVLSSAKHLQYTIVGTGSAGSIKATVRYMPCVAGAVLL